MSRSLNSCLSLVLALGAAAAAADAQCAQGWSRDFFPQGVNGRVSAQTVFDDGTGPGLYVTGAFYEVGGVTAYNVARWNGSKWSAMAGGVSGSLYLGNGNFSSSYGSALAVYDDGAGPALYVGGLFQAYGSTNSIVRWNGTSFTSLPGLSPYGLTEIYSMCVYDDGAGPELYVSGVLPFVTGPFTGYAQVAKWNGSTWTAVSPGWLGYVNTLAVHDDGSGPALYAGGSFNTVAGIPASDIARFRHGVWSTVGTGVGFGQQTGVFTLATYDDGSGPALYAGGSLGTTASPAASSVARWNGSSWSPVGSLATGAVLALHNYTDASGTRLYAAGYLPAVSGSAISHIAAWDGTQWTAPGGTGITSLNEPNSARSLAVFDDGRGPALSVGGDFTHAGGHPARNLALWRESRWSPFGGLGVLGNVRALASFGGDFDAQLFAGGSIASAGETTAAGIATFNGAAWSTVGPVGVVSNVKALAAVHHGSSWFLYAGGTFNGVGPQAIDHIARWDGAQWASLGSGLLADVLALAVVDGPNGTEVFAGGTFTTLPNGTPAGGIARWNGTSWSPLGSGTNGEVRALVIHDDGSGPALYAGGTFTTAGGVSAARIARWNGSGWSAVLGGFHHPVDALASYDAGTGPVLYAGGEFHTASGSPGDFIARFNGTAWAPVGLGTTGMVRALTVFNDGTGPVLAAGGDFVYAGSVLASRVARWDGANWSGFGGGTPNSVYALASHQQGGATNLFVGGITRAGSYDPTVAVPSYGVGRFGVVRPGVKILSTGGPGSTFFARNTDLTEGHEYFNIFSLDPCPNGPGTGPYGGLCFLDPNILIAELLAPLGVRPFHFLGSGPVYDNSAHTLPPGVTIDALCVDVTPGFQYCLSPIEHFVSQ